MKITLIGFMGSGKTTIGKMLAEHMNFDFFDIDQIIVTKFNMKISDIFKSLGEDEFRKIEKETIKEYLISNKPCIISVGGGAFCNEKNVSMINEKSLSIYLKANNRDLYKRLIHEWKNRPMISNLIVDESRKTTLSAIKKVIKLKKQREAFYQRAKIIAELDHDTAYNNAQKVMMTINSFQKNQ